jgi:hypothetical protein
MKKTQFIYQMMVETMNGLKNKTIEVEEAKEMANLAKQANKTLSLELDAAKFVSEHDKNYIYLEETGLLDEGKS